MGRHSTTLAAEDAAPSPLPSRKRKRDESTVAEIEVDVTAPEPPSKKALRKAKKGAVTPKDAQIGNTINMSSPEAILDDQNGNAKPSNRSQYGIWIGNLPWTATKADLRSFLTKNSGIADDSITRIHMPSPSKASLVASGQKIKPQNQGFAYIDFSAPQDLTAALALSEKLLSGRRLLIKDSKSYEGRPDKLKEKTAESTYAGKAPGKRVFVGNLGFDVTKEDLSNHFIRCGEILDVHVATFEDTGKCKGYGWVEFAELKAGEAAVRGWVTEDEDGEIAEASGDSPEPKKKSKPRKWWVNELNGRPLRMEFAEGKDVRYKKRYGTNNSARKSDERSADPDAATDFPPVNGEASINSRGGGEKSRRKKLSLKKVDARSIKPGAALAAAPRLTGAIVESQGRKTVFA